MHRSTHRFTFDCATESGAELGALVCNLEHVDLEPVREWLRHLALRRDRAETSAAG